MSTKVYTAFQEEIQLNPTPLAPAGGEGLVYKITNSSNYPNHCVKILNDRILNDSNKRDLKRRKIQFLISNKPTNYEQENYIFCWPIQTVFDSSGNFIGFIMPMAFAGSENLYALSTWKISNKTDPFWLKLERTSQSGFQARLQICNRIAFAVHSIHIWRKYVIVDFKPQNILINKEGKISIIDVDSFQISSGTEIKYPVDVMTIDYVPAEYHLSEQSKRTATENWDRFALAVSFYQILFGIHPFMATCDDSMDISTIEDAIKNGMFVHGSRRNHLTVIPHPHNKYNELPYQIKLLFSKAFNHNYEIDRPSAEEWGKTLHSELNQIRK